MTDTKRLCTTDQFQGLLSLLGSDSYTLFAPTLRSQAIVYDEIQSAKDLPVGWTSCQDPGTYRLKKRSDQAYFGYTVGQESWKRFLFPPIEKLSSARKTNHGWTMSAETNPPIKKMAFIGVRPCDIQAIHVQDKVFQNQIATYRQYQERRKQIFIVAVQCTESAHTCFCASMKTGPRATKGFDLALTELMDDQGHFFLIEVGSKEGERYCQKLALPVASDEACQKAARLVEQNRTHMIRQVDNDTVSNMLSNSWEKKRWDQVAERCINCTNCTMVCPTCFCSETVNKISIDGCTAERCQRWDSCFTLSHSYIHGGSIRQSAKSRYRQWLTHKFGTWWDQFGLSGCVGCGRCITWCPVGIDVTEELSELQKEKKS